VRKIVVAALYGGVDIELEEFWPRGAAEDVLKEFKKKNPNAKIPVLETPEGYIYESNAILRYIARVSKDTKLYGTSKFDQALVDQWLDWASSLLEPAMFAFASPYLGFSAYNEETHNQSREKFFKALKVLNDRLQSNMHVVGDYVTIADIHIVTDLSIFYRFLVDDNIRNQFPNLTSYVERIANEDNFIKGAGRFVSAKVPLQVYTGPLPQPEETKKPEPKQKAAPAPKKEAPKKKEKKEEEDEDEPVEKKEKNPLDSLPPSSFNLFDFKTLIVNAPSKKEAVNTFLQQFDPEGYSVWHMDYDKAEGEGNVLFLTANLMNGFLQRLETFRKYAFAVVGVYGEEPNLEIRGVWVWRGTEIPFEIKDHPSGEWYRFKKLDVKNNEADRKKLEEYWCGLNEDEDVVDGLRARIVKYYK